MVINAGMVRVNYTANNSNPTATALGNMGTAMTSRTDSGQFRRHPAL